MFCNCLREILANKNMKQADLCRLTGISSSLMSDYIHGNKEPGLSYLIAIANALDISIDELVTYTDKQKGEKHEPTINELKQRYNKLINLIPDDMCQPLLDLIEATLKTQGLLK